MNLQKLKNWQPETEQISNEKLRKVFFKNKSFLRSLVYLKLVIRKRILKQTLGALSKGYAQKYKTRFHEWKISDTLKNIKVVKYATWGPKERKRWKAHRFVGKFFKKNLNYKIWLRKSYLYKIMFKKFLKEDFRFKPKPWWTYQQFLKKYQRLLIKYVINLPVVKNIFRSRALIRHEMIKVNHLKPKLVLDDYDIVSFSRTLTFRRLNFWDRVVGYSKKDKQKMLFKVNRSYLITPDSIYNKKKFFFITLPELAPTRSSYQVRTEKRFFSTFSYRLLTIKRY